MGALFISGRIVDLVLAVLLLEIVALALWRMRRRRSARWPNLLAAALPGACLLLALRSALSGADWRWVAGFLALSFPAHLLDLWRRPP
jgi:hypothetical protein